MGLKQNLHNFKEKNKDKKWLPGFNALFTFLYMPNETTHNGTHIKAADDLKRTMNTVIMALYRRKNHVFDRIGDRYGNFIDPDHFLGRNAFEESWDNLNKSSQVIGIKINSE